ncbi:MAG: GIY-YIG nuclease family protein [Chitinophagales bacterium]
MKKGKEGFIYILLNPSFTHLLKIGKTQRTAEKRAKELSNKGKTSLPVEYIVAYDILVSDCHLVEQLVHKKLAKKRINANREFFRIKLNVAVKTIETVLKDLESQKKIISLKQDETEFTPQTWWNSLSFAWQQVFRSHLKLNYEPNEIDLVRAIHNIIDNCEHDTLRKSVTKLIAQKRFTRKLEKWYHNDLASLKTLFNSYLPYEPSVEEIEKMLKITNLNCSDHHAIIDLKPLEKLTNLRSLNCNKTSISDLNPLSKLQDLEELCLNYTNIESLVPLEKLPNLFKITCFNTKITKEETRRFEIEKPHCELEKDSFLSAVPHISKVRKQRKRRKI